MDLYQCCLLTVMLGVNFTHFHISDFQVHSCCRTEHLHRCSINYIDDKRNSSTVNLKKYVFTSKYPLRRTKGNDMIAMMPNMTKSKTPVIPAVPLTQPSPDFVVNKYSQT